jgi:hypothetical protein
MKQLEFLTSKVSVEHLNYMGRCAVKLELLPEITAGLHGVDYIDRDTFAIIKNAECIRNGVIEVDVIGEINQNAPDYARGFVGIAFRVQKDQSKFGAFYLRPSNSRSEDQVRRNHTLQYFCFPDYPYSRLRSEEPERYEAYADLDCKEWTHIKVELSDSVAKLYLNYATQPSLVVQDLKFSHLEGGGVALWLDIGTIAYFSNLRIQNS